jgi:UDP-glucuronate decarboxylase
MVDGLIRLMNTPHEVTGPINLGNPHEITMLELASNVLDLVGGNSELVHEALPADDPTQRRPTIEQAEAVLGWKPTTTLTEGLARTVDYFRSTASDVAPDMTYDVSRGRARN